MSHAALDAINARILCGITFHFRSDRIVHLAQIVRVLAAYPVKSLHVVILTNSHSEKELNILHTLLQPLFDRFSDKPSKILEIRSVAGLEDPRHLCWSHKSLISDVFLDEDKSYSHFIYLEDDIELPFGAFCYFIKYRRILREHGLVPSFVRAEYDTKTNAYYSTDAFVVTTAIDRGLIKVGNYEAMNLENPYCAMFILDQELAKEYIKTRSFDRVASEEVFTWEVSERAAMGLCWEAVPPPFSARSVIIIDYHTKKLLWDCVVYHVANNYVSNPNSPLGKMLLEDVVSAPA